MRNMLETIALAPHLWSGTGPSFETPEERDERRRTRADREERERVEAEERRRLVAEKAKPFLAAAEAKRLRKQMKRLKDAGTIVVGVDVGGSGGDFTAAFANGKPIDVGDLEMKPRFGSAWDMSAIARELANSSWSAGGILSPVLRPSVGAATNSVAIPKAKMPMRPDYNRSIAGETTERWKVFLRGRTAYVLPDAWAAMTSAMENGDIEQLVLDDGKPFVPMSFHDGYRIVLSTPEEFAALEGESAICVIRRFNDLPSIDQSIILTRLGIEADWAPKDGSISDKDALRKIVERGLLDALDMAVSEIEGKREDAAR